MSRQIDMMLLCTDAQLMLKTLDRLIITLLPLHFLKQHIPELLANGPECHFLAMVYLYWLPVEFINQLIVKFKYSEAYMMSHPPKL